jgi:hypothetical protein
MDSGKVFRRLYKKKLAEYIQQKEAKGEQETHSESVASSKEMEKVVQRSPYKLDLNFSRYDKGILTPLLPIELNVVLSIEERKKLANIGKALSNVLKLQSSQAIVDRLNNLLKRMVNETYSIDYAKALLDMIKIIMNKINVLISDKDVRKGLPSIKNVFNQIIELLEERIQERIPAEEGVPALEDVSREININFEEGKESSSIAPGKKKKKEESQVAPGARSIPALKFPEIEGKVKNAKEKVKADLIRIYEEIYPKLPTTETKNSLYKIANNFAKEINKYSRTKKIEDDFKIVIDAIADLTSMLSSSSSAPAAVEEGEEIEQSNPFEGLEESGEGYGHKRKNKYGTYRGIVGCGMQRHPVVGCGMQRHPVVGCGMQRHPAVALAKSNSPVGLPPYNAPQSFSIPKFLNIGVVPNEKGNFGYLVA